MRSALPILSVTAAALILAGCTATSTETDTATGDGSCVGIASGSTSEAISVVGAFGEEPTVTIDAPVSVEETQRTIVSEGDGEQVEAGSLALLDFTLYNAVTGELATSTGFGTGGSIQLTVDEAVTLPGIVKTVECASVGDRIASVVASVDAFGDLGYADFGIEAGDSVIFVVDVVDVVATAADGEEQDLPDDFPLSVEFDADGRPTVTIPDEDAPDELTLALTRVGDGDVVAAGDTVTVQYQGINWRTGEIFDESWGSGPTSFSTEGVIEGFGDALVGQTVGSQVVVIIPADLGYGPSGGNATAGIEEDDTIVFVVDILATQSAF